MATKTYAWSGAATSITIPGDFDPANNTLHAIGSGAGGGGGAYAFLTNAALTPGATYSVQIGVASFGSQNTWLKQSGGGIIIQAQGASGGTGGSNSFTGTGGHPGGNGVNLGGQSGGEGGGAGGPNGAGNNGGSGDAGHGGAFGGNAAGPGGVGGNGGAGAEWLTTNQTADTGAIAAGTSVGSGGGGGGPTDSFVQNGGGGGPYGGGSGSPGNFDAGGLLVLIYTPRAVSSGNFATIFG